MRHRALLWWCALSLPLFAGCGDDDSSGDDDDDGDTGEHSDGGSSDGGSSDGGSSDGGSGDGGSGDGGSGDGGSGDGGSGDGGSGDGGAGDGASGDGGSGDGGSEDPCAPHDPSTTIITETQATTPGLPEATGGTITDGTYELVRFEIYPPARADDTERARRLYVDGGNFSLVQLDGGGPLVIIGGEWETSGTNLHFSTVCPRLLEITMPFSVEGDEIWIFDTTEPNVQVYERL